MQAYWAQSIIWLGMSCHETKKKYISVTSRTFSTRWIDTPLLHLKIVCTGMSDTANFSSVMFTCVASVVCTLQSKTFPTLQHQKHQHKKLVAFLLWQNGNLPSIVSFILGSTKKKWKKKRSSYGDWNSRAFLASVYECVNQQQPGTVHTDI